MSVSDQIRQRLNPRKTYPPKECVACGDNFTRPIGMQSTTWKSKITCSIPCRNSKRTADAIRRNELKHYVGCLDDKPCLNCGANMTKGESEQNYVYIRKRTCSNVCAGILRRSNQPVKNKVKSAPARNIAWHWANRSAQDKLIHDAILRPLLRK